MKMICIFKIYYVLVLNCPEKDVSCLPSCGADGSSLGNVTSQLQCASKSASGFFYILMTLLFRSLPSGQFLQLLELPREPEYWRTQLFAAGHLREESGCPVPCADFQWRTRLSAGAIQEAQVSSRMPPWTTILPWTLCVWGSTVFFSSV